MLYGKFPVYASHEVAATHVCRSCCGLLKAGDAKDLHFPPGRGRYGIRCVSCEATFCYDLQAEIQG